MAFLLLRPREPLIIIMKPPLPSLTPLSPPPLPRWGADSVPFGPSASGVTALAMTERFNAWPALNDVALANSVGVADRSRLRASAHMDRLLSGDTLQAKLSRALVDRNAIDRKEFFETWEFFAQTRGRLKCGPGSRTLVEVAGGHGLLGLLFSVFEAQRFDRIIIADTQRPRSFDAVLAAGVEVAPWAAERLKYVEGHEADMMHGDGPRLLSAGCAVAAVHGCNSLTDAVLNASTTAGAASIAVMPCCYGGVAKRAPSSLRRNLGVALAADVERTYLLEREHGYTVTWRALPAVITPLNRILIAKRR